MVWERIGQRRYSLGRFPADVLKAVIAGYVMGCGLGFIVAILVDRSPSGRRASCRLAR
jgi:NitT/TauT family transport system permease protein